MDVYNIIDSVFKSDTNDLKKEERDDAIILLVHRFKSNGFNISQIGINEINYIVNKITLKKKNKLLDDLNRNLIFLDIMDLMRLILDSKDIELPVKEVANKELNKTVVFKNDEQDVLDEEGYMESVKTGPTYYDKEYEKLLGINDE